MTLKSSFIVKIIIFLIAFNAGFAAGVCWRSMLKDRIEFAVVVVIMFFMTIGRFFELLPRLIYNIFHRVKKPVNWSLFNWPRE